MNNLKKRIEKLESHTPPSDDAPFTIDRWRELASVDDATLQRAKAELAKWQAETLAMFSEPT